MSKEKQGWEGTVHVKIPKVYYMGEDVNEYEEDEDGFIFVPLWKGVRDD